MDDHRQQRSLRNRGTFDNIYNSLYTGDGAGWEDKPFWVW